MSEEQHLALPHLYGAPAYSRPPRPVEVIARPFDPDELPIEADRTEDDALLLAELAGNTWSAPVAVKAKPAKRLRIGRSAKDNGTTADEAARALATAPVGSEPGSPDPAGGLQGRPFRLRSLGRIFGGDQK